LIISIVDLITRKRIHPAYIVGVAVVVLGQVTTHVLAPSPVATALLHALGTR
jgi:hypothetical protein